MAPPLLAADEQAQADRLQAALSQVEADPLVDPRVGGQPEASAETAELPAAEAADAPASARTRPAAVPQRPAWPELQLRRVAPSPAWQQAVALSLEQPAPEHLMPLAPPADGTAQPIELALCAEGAARLAGPGPQWLLLDGQGCLLHTERPLWSAMSRGQGMALQLWQRPHPAAEWQCLRRVHAAADTRAGRALPALAELAARLLRQARIDHALGQAGSGPAMPLPQAPQWPRPIASAIGGHWRALGQRLRAQFTTEAWRIGIVEAPVHEWMAAGGRLPVHWLSPPGPSRYDADPMGVPGNPEVLLCETFDERIGLGWIDRLVLGADRRVSHRERLPLDEGRHVSFPMMVAIQGERYGLLEAAASGRCQLHRVDDEGRWHPIATLFEDRSLADPALFHHGGRWWLAATDLAIGSQDNLCLFHAVRPEGPWMPHAHNPVKLDIGSARMAGPVFRLPARPPGPAGRLAPTRAETPEATAAPSIPAEGLDGGDDGVLIRPGQDCLATYGRAVVLHRITELTPTRYAEERLMRIDPAALAAAGSPPLDGVHTVGPWGERTLIDAKRHVVDPQALLRKLRRRIG